VTALGPRRDPQPAEQPGAPRSKEEAFRRVFDAEIAYVWRTLRSLGVPARDVEDLAHDVFVTVFRRWDDIDPARPIRPWLFGVALRVATADRRLARNQRERFGVDVHELVDEAPPADEQLASKKAWEVVLQALEGIEIGRRAVLILHDLDGFAMRDVADALSIPTNTAYSRLRLAREDFRQAIQRVRARGGL